ncbi:hypothetical protein CDD80_6077 [Ophiocordyceps camponoti-rufipedis]|uniref:Mitochondrial distribution and morphology protein 12 n=1 Tax=Ophiocordyceps camponoti-rufipedis TaxID=2004952 RepID=A0A2C5YLC1_9HYPO|nr:hypothetical protein CDD80_6077 [Ophiocordyceps camponoti-rufipedis]
MSIDLNWEALTTGPDGDALAERIRSFIHDKFQTVPLPRFIRSVNVRGFDFGTIPPELELKDITDPLPDFYEQQLSDSESDDKDSGPASPAVAAAAAAAAAEAVVRATPATTPTPTMTSTTGIRARRRPAGLKTAMLPRGEFASQDLGSPFLGTSTPGILGGPGGRGYFQGHLGTGAQTPLAAVAGAQLGGGGWIGGSTRPSHSRQQSQGSDWAEDQRLREKSSVSTLAATSVGASRPPTRDTHDEAAHPEGGRGEQHQHQRERREPGVNDVQAVFRIRYGGDVRLNLTAEILLDYPMPSFVGIPIKLNITGLSFDGVGVLAHIRKRVHFCFLSPEDALMVMGPDGEDCEGDREQDDDGGNDADDDERHDTGGLDAGDEADAGTKKRGGRFAGLLQEVKVESEIGERDGGRQSLKNVGKVERFVLEQVRRIFEEEFVYPSFWTFLV